MSAHDESTGPGAGPRADGPPPDPVQNPVQDAQRAVRLARAAALVREAAELHAIHFPGSAFADQVWGLRHVVGRPTGGGVVVAFTVYGTNVGKQTSTDPADALPPNIADLLKAFVVLARGEGKTALDQLPLFGRVFWTFLTETDPDRAATFTWSDLTVDDVAAFDAWLVTAPTITRPKARTAAALTRGRPVTPDALLKQHGQPRSPGTRRLLVGELLAWAGWLRGHRLLGAITYEPKVADPRRVAKETPAGRQAAADVRLPPDGVLAALAAIYWRLVTAHDAGEPVREEHVLLVCLVAVQMLTGLRVRELLTMPADCERWQEVRRIGRGIAATGPMFKAPLADPAADVRYGLAFYVEKAREKRLWVRWVSPTAEPIVRNAVARVLQLTQTARDRARVLAASPTVVPLGEAYDARSEFTRSEVCQILALADLGHSLRQGPYRALPRETGPAAGSALRVSFSAQPVRALLQSLRDPVPYTILHRDGTKQALEDSLCCVHANYFRKSPQQVPRTALVTKVPYSQYHTFLSGAGGPTSRSTSVFALYGSTEEVRAYRVNSHSFRHWLTTVAYHGQMPLDRLTMYFARVHGEDTLDYVHPLRMLRDEEVAEYVQEEIAAGRVFGDIALTYWSLPADPPHVRRDYLKTAVRVGHVTPWGLCLRDFAIEPCDKDVDCLNNCPHYCGVKGDLRQIAALEDLLWRNEELLRLASEAAARGESWGRPHAAHQQVKINGIRAALAFHRDPDIPDGAERPVFPLTQLQRAPRREAPSAAARTG